MPSKPRTDDDLADLRAAGAAAAAQEPVSRETAERILAISRALRKERASTRAQAV